MLELDKVWVMDMAMAQLQDHRMELVLAKKMELEKELVFALELVILILVTKVVVKEAEAAVLLEKAAARYKFPAQSYAFDIKQKNGILILGSTSLFRKIVNDIALNSAVEKIAYRFHVTLAHIVRKTCLKLRAKTGISDVYFSGGVFMNNILVDEIKKVFAKDAFRLFFAKRPLTTDLGISQGQIAAYCMERNACSRV